MDFLEEYFQIKLRMYIPIFIILYILIFYLSTKFLITDDLLLSNFDGAETQEDIEGGHTFFNLFFGFSIAKSLLGVFLKATILSFLLGLASSTKFSKVFKVVILSSAVYIIGRAIQFIVFGLFEPEKIKTLETNIFSIYALIDHNKYSLFIQQIMYDLSLIEFVFIGLVISGLYLLNSNILLKKLMLAVVGIDIGFIIISALL